MIAPTFYTQRVELHGIRKIVLTELVTSGENEPTYENNRKGRIV